MLTVSVAGIADADDIDAETFAYQWLANAGMDDTEIAGATSKTYTVAPADAGKTLKVRVTYTDGGGTEEVLASRGDGGRVGVADGAVPGGSGAS